jgi:cell shape-determining protein MreC
MARVLYIAWLITLVVILITQVICPMFGIFSDRYFWFFRKKEKEIAKTLESINEIKTEEELVEILNEKVEKLKSLEKKKETKTENIDLKESENK